MAYEDKDLQFLYELLQKHIKFGKTPGMSLLEEIVSGVDLITHELKEANAFAAKTQNAVNKQMEKIKELKDKSFIVIGEKTYIQNDCPYDEFTLYNVVQLNSDIIYRIDEYILRKNLDKHDTIIDHSDTNITDPFILKNIISYSDIE